MPQINRIRVNNVKYNFGTQFYDDFVMRFSCKNTIYDLANGGGKSVLMLLLLQNLIPNCTLDDKQPIEKLFRTGSGSSTIHSLIEWKLDPCYMKDNYKYMTTGFCARKAKENADEVQNKDTATIEYFNYCIFYREFGDNDIRNLPLSNGKERITYQGLKNYLKELEKKDFNVSVKIFERKNEYQQFITGYGIFESQWEIIRGINKTEGHVRTYFESNYKTGRKVVEDLLIEQIIEKSFNNRIGGNTGEESMAKTLLDIKDKLVELSKKKETLDNYDKQIEAMNSFSEKTAGLLEVYNRKEEEKRILFESFAKVNSAVKKYEEAVNVAEETSNELFERQSLITRDIAISNVLEDETNLADLKAYLQESEAKLAKLIQEQQTLIKLLREKEVAMNYKSYLESEYKKAEIKETIDNRLRDFDDIKKELNSLAKAIKPAYDKELVAIRENLEVSSNDKKIKAELLKALDDKIREQDRNIAVNTKLISENKLRGEELMKQLAEYMQQVSIMVTDGLEEAVVKARTELSNEIREQGRLESLISEAQEKYQSAVTNSQILVLKKNLLEEELSKKQSSFDEVNNKKSKLTRLFEVYGVDTDDSLMARLENMVKSSITEQSELESQISRLRFIRTQFANGEYSFEEPQYREIKEYLMDTYGEDVVTGDVWLKSQPRSTQRDLLKRVPFITHSIVVKEDFERVKEDVILKNISKGAYIVPVIGEGVLYETRNAITSDAIVFAMKDISFLGDEEKTQLEISKIDEELQSLELKLEKQREHSEIIRDDFSFVLQYGAKDKLLLEELKSEFESIGAKIAEYERQSIDLDNNAKVYKERLAKLSEDYAACNERKIAWEESLKVYTFIAETKTAVSDNNLETDKLTKELKKNELEYERLANESRDVAKVLNELELSIRELQNRETTLDREWQEMYSAFYLEGVEATKLTDQAAIRAKFKGLKAVIDKEAVDVADKEKLIAAYDSAAKKAVSDIEYLGISFDEAKSLYENDKISFTDRKELYDIKDQKSVADDKVLKVSEDINAQNAVINRTEGSIAHARAELLEKYGDIEYPQVDNVAIFREEKKNALKACQQDIIRAKEDIKEKKDKYTKTLIVARDLERILKNAGIDTTLVPIVEIQDYEEEDYEFHARELERIVREESKRKETFYKDRQKLKEALEGLGAYELAFEINESIEVPNTALEVTELVNNISETNRCILLEKDRVGKGIEDMERIKDSFENRCLQTCDNIKSELERLPKLSKITLDNEVISIIGLTIPYVKDEFKKERMSSYIQEIIVGSESFKNPEERLKYIRNKLTWKKLFSVIVTDMNGVKLSLYKRERISGQSRYLRYEEAVGSTGQSQGIYIQFLIAIINYISSINAAGRAEGVLGKTIFIDNPFGAAKDTYIWEPIFKLLKTNHVQLIVPARGTTPAIVGRFDVNYILGQKLVNGVQQTVIVDYRSETNDDKLEYKRLEFAQETFNFE